MSRGRLVSVLPSGGVLVVAPEPAAWVAPLATECAAAGPVTLVAPWACGSGLVRWLPGKLRAPAERRRVFGARSIPGGWLLDTALTQVASRRPDWRYRKAFAQRVAVAHLARRALARGDFQSLIAPSLAALEIFEAAESETLVLYEDWPDLAALHADLAAAARRHPDAGFLQRFRAPVTWLDRQADERAAADVLHVRGLWAAHQRTGNVVSPPEPPRARRIGGSSGRHVLLAGGGTARSGALEVLEWLNTRPDVTLTVRLGDGAEPALSRHRQVRPAVGTVEERVQGADLVLAPSWVEGYPKEVLQAARTGTPLVATKRAAGVVALTTSRRVAVEPGDIAGLAAVCEQLLPRHEATSGAPPRPLLHRRRRT